MSLFRKCVGLLLVSFTSACTSTNARAPRSSFQPIFKARHCATEGIPNARCGVVTVLENRSNKSARTIDLNVVIVKVSGSEKHDDPIFFLAGGPGQGAAALAPLILPQLAPVAAGRDIVMFDQRGTGSSNPLRCEGGFQLLDPSRSEDLRRCAASLGQRADLDSYGSDDVALDVDDVRRALGYGRINLVAASYGTRPAQMYMRRFPQHARTSILRAVSPYGGNILRYASAGMEREFRKLVSDCRNDPKCNAAYPRFEEEVSELDAKLRGGARTITLESNGMTTNVEITRDVFRYTLYALMLNSGFRQQLPLLVHSAVQTDFKSFAPIAEQVRKGIFEGVDVGLYLSVVCSEDVPRLTAADRQAINADFGGFAALPIQACGAWPVKPATTALFADAVTDVPTLILSGAVDPGTATGGASVAASSTRAREIVMPATSHSPLFPGCISEVAKRFLDTADAPAVNADCASTLTLPPFG